MKRSIDDYRVKLKFLKKLTIIILVFSVILSLPALCESHDAGENPSFKYSRQANENFNPKKAAKEHHHHHDHDGHHDHGHHGHDHGHRGHHEHDDDEDFLKNLKPDQAPYEGLVPDPGDEDHHHRIFHADHDHLHHKKQHSKPALDMRSVWLNSIGSTLLISAAPFLLLYVIPLDNSEAMKPRLKVLLAFASGGLLGDAFLHLIPHATHPHSHHGHDHHDHHDHDDDHHHHDIPIFIHQIDDPSEHPDHSHAHDHEHGHSHGHDMSIGLWVLGGIIAFLSVEKLVRLLKGSNGSGHGHSHGHGHGHVPVHKPKPPKKTNKKSDETSKTEKEKKSPKTKNGSKTKKDVKEPVDETSTTDDDNADKKNAKQKKDEVEISGYLNLAADFAHNFTDGLAIGASYLAGNGIGIVTTLTILLHEVPHEIGDFAILIKSGCSRRKAMLLQLLTALGAVAGTALALLGVSGDSEAAPWVLPFTAGGFIYIATVSVLPELLEESTKFVQSIKEIVALLTGVGLMVLIANYE